MSADPHCAECDAILRELGPAEIAVLKVHARGARELLATLQSAGDDALEELLSTHRFPPLQPAVASPPTYSLPQFRRLWLHCACTAHWPISPK